MLKMVSKIIPKRTLSLLPILGLSTFILVRIQDENQIKNKNKIISDFFSPLQLLFLHVKNHIICHLARLEDRLK